MIKYDRTQTRQQIIYAWFAKFVEHELYDEGEYHAFCKRVKGKSQLEIERMFRLESH